MTYEEFGIVLLIAVGIMSVLVVVFGIAIDRNKNTRYTQSGRAFQVNTDKDKK